MKPSGIFSPKVTNKDSGLPPSIQLGCWHGNHARACTVMRELYSIGRLELHKYLTFSWIRCIKACVRTCLKKLKLPVGVAQNFLIVSMPHARVSALAFAHLESLAHQAGQLCAETEHLPPQRSYNKVQLLPNSLGADLWLQVDGNDCMQI